MISYLNIYIISFFMFIIILCIIILLFVFPKAVSEYKTAFLSKNLPSDKKIGLSALMEELSRCKDLNRINTIIDLIQEETNKLNSDNIVQKRQKDSVFKWLNNFSPELHIKDLKTTNKSQQITFDTAKKDFKLMIVKK